jgi:bacterioferritin (cytochrome b1)
LNKALPEIQVSIQYVAHVIIGVKALLSDQFKQTAIAEMKHAEKIAEGSGILRVFHHQPA